MLTAVIVKKISCKRCGYSITTQPDTEVGDNTCPACEMGPREGYKLSPEEAQKLESIRWEGSD